ncbi:MAG: hypothetical protein V2A58_16290 [Planctomycetota bacterium]
MRLRGFSARSVGGFFGVLLLCALASGLAVVAADGANDMPEPAQGEKARSENVLPEATTSPQALALLAALGKLGERKRPFFDEERGWGEASDEARDFVVDAAEDLKELRKRIKAARGECFALGHDPLTWYDAWGPVLGHVRRASKLLVMDSKRLAWEKRYTEALADLEASAELATILQEKAPLTALLISFVIWKMTFEFGAWDLMGDKDMPKESLMVFLESTSKDKGYAPDFDFMSWEADMFRGICVQLGEGLKNQDAKVLRIYSEGFFETSEETRPEAMVKAFADRGITVQACEQAPAIFDQMFRKMLATTTTAYAQYARTQEFTPSWIARESKGNRVVQFFLPGLLPALEQRAMVRARIASARIAAALRLYALQKGGAYPDSLEELLTAGILSSLPIDPFSGKAFRYAVKDGNVQFWSVGRDMQDNGGTPPIPGSLDYEGTDLVWIGNSTGSFSFVAYRSTPVVAPVPPLLGPP